jgi:hypothetical protein
MSEYTEVEQPFLQQLQGLGWEIIDQGQQIPSDPVLSLRAGFRQWLLPEVFDKAVARHRDVPPSFAGPERSKEIAMLDEAPLANRQLKSQGRLFQQTVKRLFARESAEKKCHTRTLHAE